MEPAYPIASMNTKASPELLYKILGEAYIFLGMYPGM
jgi:hypothetical protein